MPKLNKFYYKHYQGLERDAFDKQLDEFSQHTDVNQKALKNLEQDQICIKVENPEWTNFSQLLTVLKSAQSNLFKKEGQLRDMAASMQQKSKADATFATKADELYKAVKVINTFVDGLRHYICNCEGVTVDCDCKDHVIKAKEKVDEATDHNNAVELLKRKMRALLEA